MIDRNPRLGISQCLLSEAVRYDEEQKRDSFLADVLSPFVEWVPVCPEIEAGLEVPREAMHLAGKPAAPQLLTIGSQKDQTHAMHTFSGARLIQ